MVQERRDYEHNSIDPPDSSVDRSATRLAVQLRLGLLAKWRIRLDSFDRNYSRFDGKLLRSPLGFALSRRVLSAVLFRAERDFGRRARVSFQEFLHEPERRVIFLLCV